VGCAPAPWTAPAPIALAVADRDVRDRLASVDQVIPIALIVAAVRVSSRPARSMPEGGRDLVEPLAAEKFASPEPVARGDRSAETTVRGGVAPPGSSPPWTPAPNSPGRSQQRRLRHSVAASGDGFPSGHGDPGPLPVRYLHRQCDCHRSRRPIPAGRPQCARTALGDLIDRRGEQLGLPTPFLCGWRGCWPGWRSTPACGWWRSIRPGPPSGVGATGKGCSTSRPKPRSRCRGIMRRRSGRTAGRASSPQAPPARAGYRRRPGGPGPFGATRQR
jgi:hypothetical protein